MRQTMILTVSALVVATAAAASVVHAADEAATTVAGMLEEKALMAAYNPVLLDYLIEEGKDALPAEQREKALDQLVTGLKQDIEITPEEQRAAAMAAAGAGLAQLLGGRDTGELGGVAQDATYQIWRGWVDSAVTLQRAGYVDEANRFFAKCVEIYPYGDLRGRCAIGLAAGRPNEAFDRLMALTEAADMETQKTALRVLGVLAGSEGFPDDLRGRAIARMEEFTRGLKKASYGVDACRGLVATCDERAVPILQKLSSGMMNSDFFPCARRGLLLTFDDRSVVPLLEKQLKGGAFSTVEPHERLFAASLLMEAGEASGFTFAEQELTKKQKKGLGKLMSSSDDDIDLRPSLVTALVRADGDDAVRVLRTAMGKVEKGSWLETWIAVGLLELGDTSQLALAKAALTNPEWAFTRVRVATALAKNGDVSGIPALRELYSSAARGVEPDWGKATLAFLAGDGGTYQSGEEATQRRLIRLRQQIADGLAAIDRGECVPGLVEILGDSEPSVRLTTAYALGRMTAPEATAGLAAAMRTDFEAPGVRPRNPLVHAYIARTAVLRHGAEASAGVLGAAAASPHASVRFLSLCLQPEATQAAEG